MGIADPLGGPHLVLVGMMGCGKTTVGRLLASQLSRSFVDLDAAMVAELGMPVSEMFATHGEAWFRHEEAELLARTLLAEPGVVVSCGGGAVLSESNRDVMRRRAVVVWLRARASTLVDRNGSGAGRPLLAGNPAARIRQLTEERAPLYEDAAHVIVDVDELSANQSAEVVRAAVRSVAPTFWVR